MSLFFNAVMVVLSPLLHIIVPGLGFSRFSRNHDVWAQAARIILWSLNFVIIGTLVAAALHLPGLLVVLFASCLTLFCFLLPKKSQKHRQDGRYILMLSASFVVIFSIFSIPYLRFHHGLPTGDSQKAILWAQSIIKNNALADYTVASELLNRDRVDFFTPGLHTMTASVLELANGSLTSIGFMSIAMTLATTVIGIAIARKIFPRYSQLSFAIAIAFLLLTQVRFLRYIREPGYHYQNIIGEFFLFGLLLLGLSLIAKWRSSDMVLMVLTAISLALTHQFSAFLAFFIMMPVIAVYFIRNRGVKNLLTPQVTTLIILLFSLVFVGGLALNLQTKLGDIFTTTPHLIDQLPRLFDYPRLMGHIWLLVGVSGLLLILRKGLIERSREPLILTFGLSTIVLLLLSQGPRIFIDIPPVRALFYTALPLSISGAYFVIILGKKISSLVEVSWRRSLILALIGLVGASGWVTTVQAFHLSHTVRTNSTLSTGQLLLSDYLQRQVGPGAVLTDDFNRRSSSWLALSGRSQFNRLAADLQRQMLEANQSETRYQLYLRQLDYEKIFSLGNNQIISDLLQKHSIRWLAGINEKSSDNFAFNPALTAETSDQDITLFTSRFPDVICATSSLSENDQIFMLRASTLVNDIGDQEDTFEHLPASLRVSRLTSPEIDGTCTYRTTTSPYITTSFNVGDYVSILWDKEKTGYPNTDVRFLVTRKNPSDNLEVLTETGARYEFASGQNSVTIAAHDVPISNDGFIRLTLLNPYSAPISLDIIALGLVSTL